MLKNINPLLGPDLIYCLRAMGHGDTIAIVDANFPATACADRLIRMDGVSATDMLDAILSVMPLDTFVDNPAYRMEVVGDPDQIPDICVEFQKIIDRNTPKHKQVEKIERHSFYEHAKNSFAIVATGESRLYGNIILIKGVIDPN